MSGPIDELWSAVGDPTRKKLVETGHGEPAPHDVRISNWH